MESLPNELVVHLFRQLQLDSIHSFASTCWRYRSIASSGVIRLTNIVVGDATADHLSYLDRKSRELRLIFTNDVDQRIFLDKIAQQMPMLKRLTVENFDLSIPASALPAQLEELVVEAPSRDGCNQFNHPFFEGDITKTFLQSGLKRVVFKRLGAIDWRFRCFLNYSVIERYNAPVPLEIITKFTDEDGKTLTKSKTFSATPLYSRVLDEEDEEFFFHGVNVHADYNLDHYLMTEESVLEKMQDRVRLTVKLEPWAPATFVPSVRSQEDEQVHECWDCDAWSHQCGL